jgi:hypothetical protein
VEKDTDEVLKRGCAPFKGKIPLPRGRGIQGDGVSNEVLPLLKGSGQIKIKTGPNPIKCKLARGLIYRQ